MDNNILDKAIYFATECHEGQVRKYTGEPYITHPLEVVQILRENLHSNDLSDEILAAAVLHDVIEDCGVTYSRLKYSFGSYIASMVEGLSDISLPFDGKRAVRKEMDRVHISIQNESVHSIKLADMISNSRSIIEHDHKFTEVYVKECYLLLDMLKGDVKLRAMLIDILGGKK